MKTSKQKSAVKKAIEQAILNTNREAAKAAGFFDGRFASRVEKDKKREQSRRGCKSYKFNAE